MSQEETYMNEINQLQGELAELNRQLVGKKGREKRQIKQQIRRKRNDLKRWERRLNKLSKKAMNHSNQQEKITIRQENKTARNEDRQESKQVAYQNGIDPMGNLIGGISGIVGSVGQGASSIMGGLSGMKNAGFFGGNKSGGVMDMFNGVDFGAGTLKPSFDNPKTPDGNNNNLILIIVAILAGAFLLFKK